MDWLNSFSTVMCIVGGVMCIVGGIVMGIPIGEWLENRRIAAAWAKEIQRNDHN